MNKPLPASTVAPAPTTLTDIHLAIAATVPGNKHLAEMTPNQDAFARVMNDEGTLSVAAVFDGCGTKNYSHIGSHLGGKMLLQMIHDGAQDWCITKKRPLSTLDLKAIQRKWGEAVKAMCQVMGGDRWEDEMVHHFQFTVVGAIMSMDETMIFHAGDGYFSLNGKAKVLEAKGNAPNYPIYPFLENDPDVTDKVKAKSWITSEPVTKTALVDRLILSTDGFEYLQEQLLKKGGVRTLHDYNNSEALQMALSELQRPHLVAHPGEPTANSHARGGEPAVSDTRVSMQVDASFSLKMSFSASIRQGPLADDLALIVFTRTAGKGRAFSMNQPNTLRSTPQPEGKGVLGGISDAFSGLWNKGKQK